MKKTVNALGDICPIPLVKAKEAIKELQGAGTVEVLVDNEIAVQNLTKMANQKGYGCSSRKVKGIPGDADGWRGRGNAGDISGRSRLCSMCTGEEESAGGDFFENDG